MPALRSAIAATGPAIPPPMTSAVLTSVIASPHRACAGSGPFRAAGRVSDCVRPNRRRGVRPVILVTAISWPGRLPRLRFEGQGPRGVVAAPLPGLFVNDYSVLSLLSAGPRSSGDISPVSCQAAHAAIPGKALELI